MSNTNQLPNFKEHLLASWQRLKMTIKPLALVSLVYMLPMFLLVGLFMAAVMVFGLLKIAELGGVAAIQADSSLLLSLVSGENILALVLIFIAYIVLFTLVMAGYNASTLIIISADKQLSTKDALRLGWQKKRQFFIGALIMLFLTFGSTWLFLLPAILLMLYLTFTYYALLDTNSVKTAINRSAHLVSKNFGFVFGRLLVLFLLQIVVSGIFPEILAEISETLSMIYAPLDLIVSIGWGFLTMTYTFEMYKHLKEQTKEDKNYSANWMWWLAIVGWLIFGFAVVGFSKLMGGKVGEYIKDQVISEISKNKLDIEGQIAEAPKFTNYAPSSCGVEVPIPNTFDKESDENRHWIYEERSLNQDTFRNLVPLDKDQVVAGGFLSFKSESERLDSSQTEWKTGFTGMHIYCVENRDKLNLDQFVASALQNPNYKVTLGDTELFNWGEYPVQFAYVEGLTNGDYYKEPLHLAVSEDGNRLILFMLWGYSDNDIMADQLDRDIRDIENSLMQRNVPVKLSIPN